MKFRVVRLKKPYHSIIDGKFWDYQLQRKIGFLWWSDCFIKSPEVAEEVIYDRIPEIIRRREVIREITITDSIMQDSSAIANAERSADC